MTENNSNVRITVVVVEDHALVRDGVKKLLETNLNLEVIGEASETDEAIEVIKALKPNVALIDLQLPGAGGVAVIEAIQKDSADTKALVVSAYDDYAYITAALDAGASGYLLKTANKNELCSAIISVANGNTVLDKEVTARLNRRWHHEEHPFIELTSREADVLCAIAKGLSNKQIASKLSLGTRTVEGYVSNVLSKLGVSSRTEAAIWALDHHLIDSGTIVD